MADTMPARSLRLRRIGSALCVAALLAISTSADSYARGFGGGGGGGGGGRGGGGGFGGGGASFSGGGGHGGASISRSYGGGSGNAVRAGGATRPGADRPSVKPPIANAPSRPERPNGPTPTPPRPHPGPNPPRPIHPVVPGPIPWIPGAVAWGDNYYDEDWPVVYNTPSTCTVVTVAKVKYRQCGDKWYQRAYQGNQVVYVQVKAPR